jgi:hypothetical protein
MMCRIRPRIHGPGRHDMVALRTDRKAIVARMQESQGMMIRHDSCGGAPSFHSGSLLMRGTWSCFTFCTTTHSKGYGSGPHDQRAEDRWLENIPCPGGALNHRSENGRHGRLGMSRMDRPCTWSPCPDAGCDTARGYSAHGWHCSCLIYDRSSPSPSIRAAISVIIMVCQVSTCSPITRTGIYTLCAYDLWYITHHQTSLVLRSSCTLGRRTERQRMSALAALTRRTDCRHT